MFRLTNIATNAADSKLANDNSQQPADFKTVVENKSYLIDRTLFIKQILSSHHLFKALSYPSGFGKTFNLTMLKYFFDIRKPIENKKLFNNLLIATEIELFREQGAYPVIFLALSNIKGNNYEEAYASLNEFFSNLFQEYTNVLSSTLNADLEDKARYQKIIDKKTNNVESSLALSFLMRLLKHTYDARVIVLIDDMDIARFSRIKFLDKMMSCLATLKTNTNLKRVILTSSTPFSEDVPRGACVVRYNLNEPRELKNSFGFSLDEKNYFEQITPTIVSSTGLFKPIAWCIADYMNGSSSHLKFQNPDYSGLSVDLSSVKRVS